MGIRISFISKYEHSSSINSFETISPQDKTVKKQLIILKRHFDAAYTLYTVYTIFRDILQCYIVFLIFMHEDDHLVKIFLCASLKKKSN